MFTDKTYTRLYAELSTYRALAVMKADDAIKRNDHVRYSCASEEFEHLNGILCRHFGEVDALMTNRFPQMLKDSEFPEWPPAEMRTVFSDDEIASWPVVFTDGSAVIDECDVPF